MIITNPAKAIELLVDHLALVEMLLLVTIAKSWEIGDAEVLLLKAYAVEKQHLIQASKTIRQLRLSKFVILLSLLLILIQEIPQKDTHLNVIEWPALSI